MILIISKNHLIFLLNNRKMLLELQKLSIPIQNLLIFENARIFQKKTRITIKTLFVFFYKPISFYILCFSKTFKFISFTKDSYKIIKTNFKLLKSIVNNILDPSWYCTFVYQYKRQISFDFSNDSFRMKILLIP